MNEVKFCEEVTGESWGGGDLAFMTPPSAHLERNFLVSRKLKTLQLGDGRKRGVISQFRKHSHICESANAQTPIIRLMSEPTWMSMARYKWKWILFS